MNFNLIGSVIAIGVLALALGYGTYAYFSDVETSTGNTVTAGVLDLSDGIAKMSFSIADMKPSYHKLSPEMTLTWTENPGKLYKRITVTGCTGGVLSEPEAEEQGDAEKFDIYNYMWFDLKVNGQQVIADETTNLADIANGNWVYLGMYGEYPEAAEDDEPAEIGGGSVTIQQSFHMWTNVTNWAQGDECTFNEEFMLLQNNDPTYDARCDAVGEVCYPIRAV